MTIQALLFDLDGTLVRTNDAHVDAWLDAFHSQGFKVGRERIEREIGKGGDLLIPCVLGTDVEETYGDGLRKAHDKAFRSRVERAPVTFFEGFDHLFTTLRTRRLRTALATSASRDDVQFLERRSGRPFTSLFDAVATSKDAAVSKPAPHILEAACAKLGEDPLACVMIGDSLHDAGAARNAGVAFIAVTTGYPREADFIEAGARYIVRDLNELANSLDQALAAASLSRARFDAPTLQAMMDRAIGAARKGMAQREVPIGAALFDRDGRLVASGHNRARETLDVTAHAEMDAFRKVGGRGLPLDKGATLVSTLEPCVMCLGAAMEVGVDVVVYGLPAPADGGTQRVAPPRSPENRLPRTRGGIAAGEVRALFNEWLDEIGTPSQRPYVEQLLAETSGGDD